MELLEFVEVNPKKSPSACVIWLHGLGADGHDFEPIVPELGIPENLNIQFVFPHAPVRPVTINNHYPMRAWYDIFDMSLRQREDEAAIRDSSQKIKDLLEVLHRRGMPYEKMVLAGFSQGGAMALFTGLRFPKRLAGILGLSCYLPLATTLAAEACIENQNIPIMLAHGNHDPVVPITLGQATLAYLIQQKYAVDWQTYPMEHAVCIQEIKAIGKWLVGVAGGTS